MSQTEFPSSAFPHNSLTERDFEAVRELILEVTQTQEAQDCRTAVAIWMRAFKLFKRKERSFGVPEDPISCNFYGGVLAQLKASGKLLIGWAEHKQVDISRLGYTVEDLKACVKLLELDDYALENPLNDEDTKALEQSFA